jgi:hypothetical protein
LAEIARADAEHDGTIGRCGRRANSPLDYGDGQKGHNP